MSSNCGRQAARTMTMGEIGYDKDFVRLPRHYTN